MLLLTTKHMWYCKWGVQVLGKGCTNVLLKYCNSVRVPVHLTSLMSELVRIFVKWRTGHGDQEAMNFWSKASPAATLMSSNDNRIRISFGPLSEKGVI